MPGYSLGHVESYVLLRDLTDIVSQDRATTATLLAYIAEVDARRLYADQAFGSMFDYCVRVLHFTEDMAGMRIRAARTARRFPFIFAAIAAGRLTVTAVCLISKPLKSLRGSAARDLITAVESKTKEEIRMLLAERFPQPDLVTRVRALAEPAANCVLPSHVLERVEVQNTTSESTETLEAPRPTAAPTSVPVPEARLDRTTPLSPGRFGLQLTMSAGTRDKLQRAQELLGHAVEHNDLASVLDRALDALIEKLERRRYGATDRPATARPSESPRHIPVAVRRAVRARDGDRCTYETDAGKRCEERKGLQLDHIIPFAKGGETRVANLRLRCHAHNQLEAERAFGAGFMEARRRRRGDNPRLN